MRGEQGEQGERGERGPQGEEGRSRQGIQGVQGFQGIQGEAGGQRGEKGVRGVQGEQGEPGHSVPRPLIWLAAGLVSFGIFWQSYNGRRDVVQSNRNGCLRSAVDRAVIINNIYRPSQLADQAISRDPFQSQKTRVARGVQAAKENTGILLLESHTDRSAWSKVPDYPQDQQAIRHGAWIPSSSGKLVWHPPFRCDQAYPPATPLQFFH